MWSPQRWAVRLSTPGRQLMKPKLVRHRLPPVIGFENLQLKFCHAELSAQLAASSRAQGCVAGPCELLPSSSCCTARPSLHVWRAEKETCFLAAPCTYQFSARTGEAAAGQCWSRWCADTGGSTSCHQQQRSKRRKRRVPCHTLT